MITPSKTTRRPLKFKTPAELEAELDRLKTGKYKKHGSWNLPQACRHLSLVIEGSLTPAPNDEPTPEELAMKEKFFAMVRSPEGMPEKLPIGNPALVPPEDCGEIEIDRLKNAFKTLSTLPHKQIKVGRCGPVPVAEVADLHLIHCAHHLSFLEPVSRRELSYGSVDDAIADLNHLRKGYIQTGQWTLPQMCRHIRVGLAKAAQPAPEPATPEQDQQRPVFEKVLASGKIPTGLQAPSPAIPPADCQDEEIDQLMAAFERFKTYAEPRSAHPRFGPLDLPQLKRIILIHAAHHLSYLIPTTDV
jgi:hypothetical protein